MLRFSLFIRCILQSQTNMFQSSFYKNTINTHKYVGHSIKLIAHPENALVTFQTCSSIKATVSVTLSFLVSNCNLFSIKWKVIATWNVMKNTTQFTKKYFVAYLSCASIWNVILVFACLVGCFKLQKVKAQMNNM